MSKASMYFTLGHIDGKHDTKVIKQGLDALPGVSSVSVNDGSGRVAVDFDPSGVQSAHIQKQLEKMGYEVLNSKLDEQSLVKKGDN